MTKTKTVRGVTTLVVNLKTRLDALDWKYRDLARSSGVPEGTIKQIMRGANYPSLNTVDDLAFGLGCKTWELLSDDTAPAPIPVNPKAILLEAAEVLAAYGKAEQHERDQVRRTLGLLKDVDSVLDETVRGAESQGPKTRPKPSNS